MSARASKAWMRSSGGVRASRTAFVGRMLDRLGLLAVRSTGRWLRARSASSRQPACRMRRALHSAPTERNRRVVRMATARPIIWAMSLLMKLARSGWKLSCRARPLPMPSVRGMAQTYQSGRAMAAPSGSSAGASTSTRPVKSCTPGRITNR